MRNKAFEKLLKEAILLDAEEQGARIEPCSEPIPEAAQARFDAALNGNRKEPKRTASEAPSEQPQPVKRAHRWLAYGLTAVSAAAVILVVVLLIGTGGLRGTKSAEPGEPFPRASATFADENAAIVAMMRFYEENRTLLLAVAADLKAPEHGEIENGVVYPITTSGLADRDHPYASTTDSIKAFLDLPDSGDYNLWWNDSVFYVSLRWTNDSGYYSTNLVFAEDGQRIVKLMYEEQGVILEPVYEDSAWGVYTVCWRKAPYYHDSSYALGPETGVWEPFPAPGTTSEPLPEPGGGSNFGPAFILNGKELDVYTEHYFIVGTDDDIPLNAFLSSIGSYYVDSPYNKYQVQCYEIEGIRYIYDWESQVFALAEQYDSVVQAAKTKGRMPTEAEFQAIDLLPAGVEMQAEAWLDHSTLESVLRKMGLDITIELDREENAIRVTMSEPEAAAVPDDPEPEPVEIRAEDLEGVWREWTPDNVDVGYRLTLFRDGTAKMVYQIPLSGEQTIEGTYSVKNGITVTFGDETTQAVYDPESDALLLFESETSWLTLYRNPDTYMLEHWFEMQRKPLLKKTVAMEDLFGVWTLERAESAFSSFDLSGLSGYLSIEQGSFRIGMRLAGEDHSASLACSVIDSVLTETGNSNGKIIAILDPYTNELKLCTLFYERELTEADPVLVFRKLSVSEGRFS